MRIRGSSLTLLACALPLFAAAGPAYAAEADFEKLLTDKSAAVVTVKFVMKIKGAQGEAESESEAPGVMLESDGLLVSSNSQLGGGPMMRPGVSATPSEIKILIGDDTQGVDARLIARDSELDLCWLRIKDPKDRKFACIELAQAAAPKIGEKLYTLTRLGKYFDRALVVRETRLGGMARKPRSLLVPSPSLGDLGLPVFSERGDIVGITVVQLPDAEELQAASSMSAFAGARGLILPAAEIVKATKRAKDADEKGDAVGEEKAAGADKP